MDKSNINVSFDQSVYQIYGRDNEYSLSRVLYGMVQYCFCSRAGDQVNDYILDRSVVKLEGVTIENLDFNETATHQKSDQKISKQVDENLSIIKPEKNEKTKKKKKEKKPLSTSEKVKQAIIYAGIMGCGFGSIIAIGYGKSNLLLWQVAGMPINILTKTVDVAVDKESSFLSPLVNGINCCITPIFQCSKNCFGIENVEDSAQFTSQILVESGVGLGILGVVAGLDFGVLPLFKVTKELTGAFTWNFGAPYLFKAMKFIAKKSVGLKEKDD